MKIEYDQRLTSRAPTLSKRVKFSSLTSLPTGSAAQIQVSHRPCTKPVKEEEHNMITKKSPPNPTFQFQKKGKGKTHHSPPVETAPSNPKPSYHQQPYTPSSFSLSPLLVLQKRSNVVQHKRSFRVYLDYSLPRDYTPMGSRQAVSGSPRLRHRALISIVFL